jgi:hypothetical protein
MSLGEGMEGDGLSIPSHELTGCVDQPKGNVNEGDEYLVKDTDRHALEPSRRKAQALSTECQCASGLCSYESIPRQLLQQRGDDIAACGDPRHERTAVLCHAWD